MQLDLTVSMFILHLLFVAYQCAHCFNYPIHQLALDINPNAPRTRGSKFAFAFMNNNDRIPRLSRQQLGMFVTTEQESSTFTIQTRFLGVADFGFTETSPGSGLWSRTEVAVRGRFIFISFPAGGTDPPHTLDGVELPDIAVQDNGQSDASDRLKGVIVEAENSTHELTVYMLSDEAVSADAFMAINCVEFPNARDYQYYVFSSATAVLSTPRFSSRFLITFCEDDTQISVRPALPQSHPDWVNPVFSRTDPRSSTQDETSYARTFNRFDTIMLSNNVEGADLTGSIVIANRPVSVFVGHQCGTPGGVLTCDYLVEQVPPHATYGDLFYLAPFRFRESGEIYRIGTLNRLDEVTVTINNCNCLPSSGDGLFRVDLQGAGSVQTAALRRGQYVECQTPEDTQTFCSIQSSNPVTVMAYTIGNTADSISNLPPPLNMLGTPVADPAMVYIPPATSYLNSYTVSTTKTTQFQGLISYILPARIFDNSVEDQNKFQVNGEVYIPEDGYQPINCGNPPEVCAYGASGMFNKGEFSLSYDNIGDRAFWGYAYGYAHEESFAYPLAFEMEPTGLAWITACDRMVLESGAELVELGFEIVHGDRSFRTRAFAYTDGGSATAGQDYSSVGTRPGEGDSNLRWGRVRQFPNNPFTVQINDDTIPEPVEVVQVQVRCEALEHCYSPRSSYKITIIDDQGGCADLPSIPNLRTIDYSYDLETPFPRHPYGTVAMYTCEPGFVQIENETRACENGIWTGTEPECVLAVGMLSFKFDTFSFVENEEMGFLEFSLTHSFNVGIDFNITSVPLYNASSVAVSAPSLPSSLTFPSDQTTFRVPFTLVDDDFGVELDETYNLTLTLSQSAIDTGVSLVPGDDTALLAIQDNEKCGQPFTPSNGHIVLLTGTTPESLVQYGCDFGYTMMGIAHRICLESGWIPKELPTCHIVDCGPLTPPVNGRVLTSPSTMFNSTATYICDTGYILEQTIIRTCQASGYWSNSEPRCISVRCMDLTEPSYGQVIVNGTTFMSTATYSCNEGHRIRGLKRMIRTCNASGQWTPNEEHCEPVDCGSFPTPLNGQVMFSTTTFMSVVLYNCDSGYALVGPKSRICEANQHWSPAAPVCQIVDCGPLGAPKNGLVNTGSGTTYTSVAEYSCLEGYILNGYPTRTCTASGQWSSSAPSCMSVMCGEPKSPPNGQVSTSLGSNFRSIATYSCDPDYNLTGCAVTECLSNGHWSCNPPFCADNAMIQFQIGPTIHCVEWTEEKVKQMYKLMHSSISTAVRSSGHVIPKENIKPGYFSCYRSTTETTYRTTITGTERVSAVDYAALIQQWVDSGVTTRVLWCVIKFDKNCPVSISSMENDECE